jgi:tetratricopeptide (TPR) repeat protein
MGGNRWLVVGGVVGACVVVVALPADVRIWGLLAVVVAAVLVVVVSRPAREVHNQAAGVEAGQVVQVGNAGTIVVGRSMSAGRLPVSRLPGCTSFFTGRGDELDSLSRAVDALERSGRVVHVLHGPEGIGKTELALRFAHQMEWAFDQRLFLDLAGTADGVPQRPEDALAQVLADPDVGARQTGSAAGLRSLWRARLAESRVLLVLDNVRSADQVVGLLPERRDCAFLVVLVVSRSPQEHLCAALGADHLELDAFPADDAVTLLRRCSGRVLSDGERVSARELVRRCRYSPLEIRLYGARLRTEALSVDGLLAEVPDSGEPHEEPSTPGFAQAYHRLDATARHVLRHVGVHPGPDFDAGAAGALAVRKPGEVREALCALEERALITRDGDRYRLHERFQRTVAGFPLLDGAPAESDPDLALYRLLCHYRRTALEVAAPVEPLLTRHRRPGVPPGGTFDPEQRASALAWFKAERANVLACLRVAAGRTFLDGAVVSLIDAVAGFLRHEGPWETAAQLHGTAARLAARQHRPRDYAVALNDLGIINRLLGHYDATDAILEEAYRTISDLAGDLDEDDVRIGKANARNEQGKVANLRGASGRSREVLEEALDLYRSAGDTMGTANAEKNLGVTWYQLGNRVRAHGHFQEALDHYAALDDQLGMAEVHNHRGFLFLDAGDVTAALAEFRTAQEFAPTHSLLERARALEGLAACSHASGDDDFAARYLREAIAGYDGIGAMAKAQELTLLRRTD